MTNFHSLVKARIPALGIIGDLYYATDTKELFVANGPSGAMVAAFSIANSGIRGTYWYTGTGAPPQAGGQLPEDLYLDTSTGNIWRFDGAHWLTAGTLPGGPGPAGPQGPPGSGGAPAGSNIVIIPTFYGSASGGQTFVGSSLIFRIDAHGIVNAGSAFKINFKLATSGSTTLTVNKAVLRKYVAGATDASGFVSSAQITWGGSASPVLQPGSSGVGGDNWSDAISMAIDAGHDYILVVYVDPASNDATVPYITNYIPGFFSQQIIAGDWTGYNYPWPSNGAVNRLWAIANFATA